MTQQYIVMGIVAFAALFLLREVIGWVVRGGKSANCPGCGSCGKPTKSTKDKLKSLSNRIFQER